MKNYDPTKPSIYIPYVDINDFHGCRMSCYLPYCGFKWLKNADNLDGNAIGEKSPIGYIFQDDLNYLDELYAFSSRIPYDVLSDCCKRIADEYGIKVDDIMKLIPNLGGKTNYVLHYKTFSCICLQE